MARSPEDLAAWYVQIARECVLIAKTGFCQTPAGPFRVSARAVVRAERAANSFLGQAADLREAAYARPAKKVAPPEEGAPR